MAFADFKKRFLGDSAKPGTSSKRKIEEDLFEVGRKCVDEKDESALREVVNLGYRPLPGEN